MTEYIFYFFGAVAVLSAAVILFTTNILHAAFSLVATFLALAAIYVLAEAEFVGITQIMVYVGGIVVLLIFGVMLTNKLTGESIRTQTRNRFFGPFICVVMAVLLITAIGRINFDLLKEKGITDMPYNHVEQLGIGMMSDYLLPFEIAAILLLAALIGAATIAGHKKEADDN